MLGKITELFRKERASCLLLWLKVHTRVCLYVHTCICVSVCERGWQCWQVSAVGESQWRVDSSSLGYYSVFNFEVISK